MVSGFTSMYSMARPIAPTTAANARASAEWSSRMGKGRARVRAIMASIFCSSRQLLAAAEPATSAIPIAPNTSGWNATTPGVARNIPITAVKTMSDSTRGLVSARKWWNRSAVGRKYVVLVMVFEACPIERDMVIPRRGDSASRCDHFERRHTLEVAWHELGDLGYHSGAESHRIGNSWTPRQLSYDPFEVEAKASVPEHR